MTVNKIIHDENELKKFLALIPELKDGEVYFLYLACRNKLLTMEERKELNINRSTILERKICSNVEDIINTLKKWECNEQAWINKKTGKAFPNICLTPYITIQPSSIYKAYEEFNSLFTKYLIELRHNRSDTIQKMKNPVKLLLDCHAHNYSRKPFIPLDLDIEDKNSEIVSKFEKAMKSHDVNFIKIETNGGFHYLLSHVMFNYNVILEQIGLEMKTLGLKGEFIKNENNAIPIPGTFQYGTFGVKVVENYKIA